MATVLKIRPVTFNCPQYTSDVYQQTLRALGVQCSMSRRDCCYDNAVMERIFWSLKHE